MLGLSTGSSNGTPRWIVIGNSMTIKILTGLPLSLPEPLPPFYRLAAGTGGFNQPGSSVTSCSYDCPVSTIHKFRNLTCMFIDRNHAR